MRLFPTALAVAVAVSAAYGCRKRSFSESGAKSVGTPSDDSSSTTPSNARFVEIQDATDALLKSIEKSDMLAPRYKDGTRFEACWVNPAGKELVDVQRAFYCAVPLEVRLCNTPDLKKLKKERDEGTLSASDYADKATEAFVTCQKKVDEMLGDEGTFLYDPKVNDVYRSVFIEKSIGLSDDEQEKLAARYKPYITGRSFPELFATSFKDIQNQLEEFEQAKKGLPKWEARILSFKTLAGLILDEKDETVL